MNKKASSRLVVVGGIIVIAILVIVAVMGAGGSAKALGVQDVAQEQYAGKKVQVSGSVVEGSFSSEGSAALFSIADKNDPSATLQVRYEGAIPATFGTGVVAICTGTVENGVLQCTEMVTKCPSKYESAEGSLTVSGLLAQADSMVDVDTKICGYVVEGSLGDASQEVRFVLESQGQTVDVLYDGGLDENIKGGSAVVVSGHLNADGTFSATEQPALDSSVESR